MARAWLPASLLVATSGLPAAENSPLITEISHRPQAPHSGETVRIMAKAATSISNLVLHYQLVDPGQYLELRDPAYQTRWLSLPMQRSTPAPAGSLYSAELPAALQIHRRLVRYRLTGWDSSGQSFTIPSPNDSVSNFAYFVYDGVPAWTGAINSKGQDPKQRTLVTFNTNVMRRVQSYHLIGKAQSIENATWKEQTGGKEYRYNGTLVADGVVYDHIRYRARGGGWRYAMGKNMWKFAFSKAQPLMARDDYGRPYPVAWDKLNLRACIQQGDYGHRGEQGMFEAVGFRLFNLAGTAAPFTHWIQLRIITDAEEAPADQYHGDFWGLYLAFEEVDGRFLKAHRLGDGNVYKMEGGTGTLSHQGKNAVTNRSDLDKFLGGYNGGAQSESWWRANLNLPAYYSYRAICEGIHHYDIAEGKNYFYHLDARREQWQVIPWDIDLTWADNMYGGGEEPFNSRVLSQPVFRLEYQNRLREIRDLLFNSDEAGRLIEESAAIVADPAGGLSPVDADRAKWDYHPVMAMGGKAGQGLFYQIAPTRDFRGMVELMKNYVKRRAAWIDINLIKDLNIPVTPTTSYAGPPGFPLNRLSFRASEYRGTNAFAAMQWRLAEIDASDVAPGEQQQAQNPASAIGNSQPARPSRPTAPGKYEITPIWESGALANQSYETRIPAAAVCAGHTYRIRVRMKDVTDRWSHWSAPVEFVAGSSE